MAEAGVWHSKKLCMTSIQFAGMNHKAAVNVGGALEEWEGVDELAKQCGQARLGGEDRALNPEALGTPEAALGPVCEGPGYAQLLQ